MVGRRGDSRKVPASERRLGQEILVHRRANHRKQPHGRASRLGAHLQGPVPALQDHEGLPAAVPERLRLPGAVGRGGGREGAWARLEARNRGLRHREVRGAVQGPRPQVRRRPDGAVSQAGLLDGLGQLLLHDVRREQLHDLALPEGVQRAGLDLRGHRRDALVPQVRHRPVAAGGGDRGLQGDSAPRPLRQVPAARPGGRVAPRLDDHALDAHRQHRRVRPPRADLHKGPHGRGRGAVPAQEPAVGGKAGARGHRRDARRGPGRPAIPRTHSTSCPSSGAWSTASCCGTR